MTGTVALRLTRATFGMLAHRSSRACRRVVSLDRPRVLVSSGMLLATSPACTLNDGHPTVSALASLCRVRKRNRASSLQIFHLRCNAASLPLQRRLVTKRLGNWSSILMTVTCRKTPEGRGLRSFLELTQQVTSDRERLLTRF